MPSNQNKWVNIDQSLPSNKEKENKSITSKNFFNQKNVENQ